MHMCDHRVAEPDRRHGETVIVDFAWLLVSFMKDTEPQASKLDGRNNPHQVELFNSLISDTYLKDQRKLYLNFQNYSNNKERL